MWSENEDGESSETNWLVKLPNNYFGVDKSSKDTKESFREGYQGGFISQVTGNFCKIKQILRNSSINIKSYSD